ncbi:hypothetical protein N7489_006062 [Penicillium chrysogenum]|uniref:uncharacterized protein n=1 Tax=Penicillium chrysogenum TaxID=5076 RepID=UPI0023A423C5|nr:uncharacterized protein N7489_006062 [Penicillium chrysogenum]KAJ5235971.1 hypothetical protein N7489_006062 [Penicillium chrysogenum]KAJ5275909.1 hypothetical protein N7524_002062 [Penicillium chrysogenum]
MGEEQRHLLHVLIDRGVDVKARNEHGVFMTGLRFFRSIGNEVLEAFEKAGYDIMAMMGMDSRFCIWWLVSCLIVPIRS